MEQSTGLEVSDSDFAAFMEAAPALRPDPATVATVPLWGIKWGCSFDGERLALVMHQGGCQTMPSA